MPKKKEDPVEETPIETSIRRRVEERKSKDWRREARRALLEEANTRGRNVPDRR